MDDLQALAELAGSTMFERDPASQALGMRLDEIRPGYARMTMAVRQDMLNGHQTCHGGYIFMLADSVGIAQVVTVLSNLAATYGEERYRVSPLLRRKLANGTRFHG